MSQAEFSPGDIVELSTDHGYAYVQVTHDHPAYPEVVRGLPGLHASRPRDLTALAQQEATFCAMFPIKDALQAGRLDGAPAGTAPIPEAARRFPTFRIPIRDRSGAIVYWWFWDGEGLTFDAEPGPEMNSLPMREVLGAHEFLRLLTGTG